MADVATVSVAEAANAWAEGDTIEYACDLHMSVDDG